MVFNTTDTAYAPERMNEAFEDFRRRYPAYDSTHKLDDLRASEYSRLDKSNHVYLDYTGGGLYAQSQLDKHMALLRDEVYGNPHSTNLTSMAATKLVEHAR